MAYVRADILLIVSGTHHDFTSVRQQYGEHKQRPHRDERVHHHLHRRVGFWPTYRPGSVPTYEPCGKLSVLPYWGPISYGERLRVGYIEIDGQELDLLSVRSKREHHVVLAFGLHVVAARRREISCMCMYSHSINNSNNSLL